MLRQVVPVIQLKTIHSEIVNSECNNNTSIVDKNKNKNNATIFVFGKNDDYNVSENENLNNEIGSEWVAMSPPPFPIRSQLFDDNDNDDDDHDIDGKSDGGDIMNNISNSQLFDSNDFQSLLNGIKIYKNI